jgi:hypothetical protein
MRGVRENRALEIHAGAHPDRVLNLGQELSDVVSGGVLVGEVEKLGVYLKFGRELLAAVVP